jgi:hypothetical protein
MPFAPLLSPPFSALITSAKHQAVIRKKREPVRIWRVRTKYRATRLATPSTTLIMAAPVRRMVKKGTTTVRRSRTQTRAQHSSRWKLAARLLLPGGPRRASRYWPSPPGNQQAWATQENSQPASLAQKSEASMASLLKSPGSRFTGLSS